jgi:hypothetical protein
VAIKYSSFRHSLSHDFAAFSYIKMQCAVVSFAVSQRCIRRYEQKQFTENKYIKMQYPRQCSVTLSAMAIKYTGQILATVL